MGLHTYGVSDVPPGLRTRSAAERRWIRIPIPVARRRAYGGEIPNLVQTPNKGSPLKGRRKEKERDQCYQEKGHATPPYISQGGVPPSLNFPCGTKPKGRGGVRDKGVWPPPLAQWAKGGGSVLL